MARITPQDLFPGSTMSPMGNGILIAFEDLPGVTPEEIDPFTGDGSVFLRALIEGAFERLQQLSAEERPTRMSMARGTQSTVPGLRNALRQPYTVTFDVTAADFEVAAE